MLTSETSQPRGPGPLAALVVLIAAVGGMLGVSLLLKHPSHPVLAVLLPQLTLVLVVIAAVFIGRWQPAACGMRRPQLRYLLIGFLMMPLVIGVAIGLQQLVFLMLGPVPDALKQGDQKLLALYAMGGWSAMLLLTCVLPGIVEELLMRGVVLSGLRRACPPWAAVLVTSLLFAAMHGSPWRFAPQFTLGLAVGWLAVRSGSCWPGALTHATYNAVAVVLLVVHPQ